MEILNGEENHQLMLGALDVMAIGGDAKSLPFLRKKVVELRNIGTKTIAKPKPGAPVFYYPVLRIKAERAISAIEERTK